MVLLPVWSLCQSAAAAALRTCDTEASANGLVQEQQAILPVPFARVAPQRHVCLQLEGTV
jgi:hypothetical protein